MWILAEISTISLSGGKIGDVPCWAVIVLCKYALQQPSPPLPAVFPLPAPSSESRPAITIYFCHLYLRNSTPFLSHYGEQHNQNSLGLLILSHEQLNNWIDYKEKVIQLECFLTLIHTYESTHQCFSMTLFEQSIKRSCHSAHGKNGSHLEPPMKMLRLSSQRAIDIFSMGRKEQVSLKENTLTTREQVASIVNALTTFLN